MFFHLCLNHQWMASCQGHPSSPPWFFMSRWPGLGSGHWRMASGCGVCLITGERETVRMYGEYHIMPILSLSMTSWPFRLDSAVSNSPGLPGFLLNGRQLFRHSSVVSINGPSLPPLAFFGCGLLLESNLGLALLTTRSLFGLAGEPGVKRAECLASFEQGIKVPL